MYKAGVRSVFAEFPRNLQLNLFRIFRSSQQNNVVIGSETGDFTMIFYDIAIS